MIIFQAGFPNWQQQIKISAQYIQNYVCQAKKSIGTLNVNTTIIVINNYIKHTEPDNSLLVSVRGEQHHISGCFH